MNLLHGYLGRRKARPEDPKGPMKVNCPRCGESFAIQFGTVAVYNADRVVITCPRCKHWEAVE